MADQTLKGRIEERRRREAEREAELEAQARETARRARQLLRLGTDTPLRTTPVTTTEQPAEAIRPTAKSEEAAKVATTEYDYIGDDTAEVILGKATGGNYKGNGGDDVFNLRGNEGTATYAEGDGGNDKFRMLSGTYEIDGGVGDDTVAVNENALDASNRNNEKIDIIFTGGDGIDNVLHKAGMNRSFTWTDFGKIGEIEQLSPIEALRQGKQSIDNRDKQEVIRIDLSELDISAKDIVDDESKEKLATLLEDEGISLQFNGTKLSVDDLNIRENGVGHLAITYNAALTRREDDGPRSRDF